MLRTGRQLLEEDIAIHVLKVSCFGFAMKPLFAYFYTFLDFCVVLSFAIIVFNVLVT